MPLESWNSFFQISSAILLGLTFLAGVGAILTDRVLSRRRDVRVASAEEEIKAAAAVVAEADRKAAEAGEGTAQALAEVAAAKEREAALALKVEEQREKTANAERALLELRQRVADRSLTAEQRKTLTAHLATGAKGPISIVCMGWNPEPCAFAVELADILRLNGWTVDFDLQKSELVFGGGGSTTGLIIWVRDLDTPRATVLHRALQAAGLDPDLDAREHLDEDSVKLVVGYKP